VAGNRSKNGNPEACKAVERWFLSEEAQKLILQGFMHSTFRTMEEIEEMEHWDDSRINEKKEVLAFELTKLVHGEAEAVKARDASHALFAGGGDDSNMPTTGIPAAEVPEEGIAVMDLLQKCGLIASRGEGRRLIDQGGLTANQEKVSSIDRKFTAAELKDGVILKKGKKVFHKAVLA
ncbi:MAG: hypothetical protein IKY02_06075, partial [Lachnospiraceae bacterium]|nr:hypothetical protein [Lachnospiraceae bacterium]